MRRSHKIFTTRQTNLQSLKFIANILLIKLFNFNVYTRSIDYVHSTYLICQLASLIFVSLSDSAD